MNQLERKKKDPEERVDPEHTKNNGRFQNNHGWLVGRCTPAVARVLSHITHHTSHITASHITHQTSNIEHQTSNIKHQTSNIKHHHKSHNITHHRSQITTHHHTSPHITTQHHTTPHNTTQHHTTPHNATQHHTTTHNTTHHQPSPHNTTQQHTFEAKSPTLDNGWPRNDLVTGQLAPQTAQREKLYALRVVSLVQPRHIHVVLHLRMFCERRPARKCPGKKIETGYNFIMLIQRAGGGGRGGASKMRWNNHQERTSRVRVRVKVGRGANRCAKYDTWCVRTSLPSMTGKVWGFGGFGGLRSTHLLLVLLIWPLTTHPLRDKAPGRRNKQDHTN